MKKILATLLILIFSAQFAYAGPKNKRYTLDGTAKEMPRLIEAVFNKLKSSGILISGYPKYSKTEIVGEYWGPHTIKANPIASVDSADSILVDEGKFITFELWGLNQRLPFKTDFIYLLKEKDEEAIRNGMQGVQQNKYFEFGYQYLFNVTESGVIGDSPEAERIILLIRESLLEFGCKEIR